MFYDAAETLLKFAQADAGAPAFLSEFDAESLQDVALSLETFGSYPAVTKAAAWVKDAIEKVWAEDKHPRQGGRFASSPGAPAAPATGQPVASPGAPLPESAQRYQHHLNGAMNMLGRIKDASRQHAMAHRASPDGSKVWEMQHAASQMQDAVEHMTGKKMAPMTDLYDKVWQGGDVRDGSDPHTYYRGAALQAGSMLQGAMEHHAAQQAQDPKHWGFTGDMAYVHDLLRSAHGTLTGKAR